MLIYALAKALCRHPKFNSYFKQDRIVLQKEININCAVAAGDGLYVPVIKTADLKEIQEIDRELKRLIAKTKNGKLEGQDLLDGTFTITNLGMYPVDEFGAIINPPQAGIIAVGKMEKRLHIDDNNCMTIRTACTVTGSFDHRIVNGALGAEFMSTLKQIIEKEMLSQTRA
jgi:pyruvate dehydrogenase E2 component (dihydrolipoamide acetyltransferase)